MKKIILLLLSIYLYSCDTRSKAEIEALEKVKNDSLAEVALMDSLEHPLGNILCWDGNDSTIKIKYMIAADFNKNVSTESFQDAVSTASIRCKVSCKYPLTYVPKKIFSYTHNDTLSLSVTFICKNGFGVPEEDDEYFKFIIKQDSLILIERKL